MHPRTNKYRIEKLRFSRVTSRRPNNNEFLENLQLTPSLIKTILLGGANSGQTSIKCRDSGCDVESPPSENCKASNMNLKVKYLFPSSSSGANFCIYQLPECLGMRKINISTWHYDAKESTNQGRHFLDFYGFS